MAEFNKIEELEEIVKKDPNNFQARRELSIALLDKGFNKDALKQINFLLGIFPDDARLYYNQAIALEKLNKENLAENAYLKAIEIDNSQTDFLYNLAYLYLQQKKYEKSLELFWQVIERDSQDANVFFNIGFLLGKLKKHEEAIEYLKKAYELNNNDTLALFYTAYEYSCLENFDEAKKYYYYVIENCPDYSWAYFNLATIDYKQGNINSAFELLQKTLEYNPKDIGAYKFCAKILIDANQLEQAQQIIEVGLGQCENDANLYYYLGQINKLQNNIKGYVQNLKNAIKNHITLDFPVSKIKTELTNFIEQRKK